jgi:hypothetical protein
MADDARGEYGEDLKTDRRGASRARDVTDALGERGAACSSWSCLFCTMTGLVCLRRYADVLWLTLGSLPESLAAAADAEWIGGNRGL